MVAAAAGGCAGTGAETDASASSAGTSSVTSVPAESRTDDSDGIAENTGRTVTIGFAQIGAESDWRMASTSSMQNAFSSANGYHLIYDDAQQKQENQIKAIREFIDQDVDYIILDPITEKGWDSSMEEARDAGIPVIIVDRSIDISDSGLYTAWVGSDFYMEGQKMCAWLDAYLAAKGITGNVGIADIQGTIDSSAQIGRSLALTEAIQNHGSWKLIAQESGDFTTAKGQEVMESMLKQYGSQINVVYCENDNEAYGALNAIREAGYTAGPDISAGQIMVLSFDATKNGLTETLSGSISADMECNPLYGPILTQVIQTLKSGGTWQKSTTVDEGIFSAISDVKSISVGAAEFRVTNLTEAVLKSRPY